MKSLAFLSKSTTTRVAGLGTPVGLLVVTLVVTSRLAGVRVVFESLFGAILTSIDCEFPSVPVTGGPATATEAMSAASAATAMPTIRVGRLRIELFLLGSGLARRFPFP